jgi:TetR/AcrR family transcriptional regulator
MSEDSLIGDNPSQWELRTVARSLERARERLISKELAVARAIVGAARTLLHETGGWDFTVKEVSERAGVSLQTLYRHFPTKDDLLLAVLEQTYIVGAAATEKMVNEISDPILKVRTAVMGRVMLLKSTMDVQRNAATVREHVRLAQIRPTDVEAAVRPQVLVIADALRQCATMGVLPARDAEREAEILWHLSSFVYDRLAAQPESFDDEASADLIWDFCLAALRR